MKLLTFAGIVFFVGSIFLFASDFALLKIEKEGEIVFMKIEKLPASCLGTKVNHYVILSYAGEIFEKKIGGMFCDEHHVGELIEMKYLEGGKEPLFPKESVISNLISCSLLGLIGLIISAKQVFKK